MCANPREGFENIPYETLTITVTVEDGQVDVLITLFSDDSDYGETTDYLFDGKVTGGTGCLHLGGTPGANGAAGCACSAVPCSSWFIGTTGTISLSA